MQINNKTRRQLSLEQSSMATVQDPRHHVETLQLPKEQNQRQRRRQQRRRRQWSADDAASLEVYTNFSKLEKPKVRMAWADSDNNESIEHVEIIARQIPTARKSRISNTRPAGGGSVSGSKTDFGLSRSIENGKKKLNSTSSLEKAAILCSRQELAERLRLAWKHRQETRTNINIFLARHTSEEYSNSELSVTRTTATTTPLSFIASTNDDHPTKSFAAESTCLVDSVNRCANLDSSAVEMTIDDTCEDKEDVICASECRKGQLNEDLRSYDKISNYSNEEYKGEFKEDEFGGENSKEVENLGNVRFKVNEEASIVIETEIQDETRTVVIKSRDTAKEKRASFRSCANKAFLVPMVDLTKPTETDEKSKRTKSAPPGERAGDGAAAIRQINGRAICNQMDKVTDKVDDRNNGKFENTSSANVNREQRSVRSAPTKRRSKSKRRTSQACREEENDENRKKGENRSVARRGKDCRLTDVVTMVSLVSSADSDSEEENSPSDDKLINELRKKLPTTPIIKTASPSTYRTIRKPLKTALKEIGLLVEGIERNSVFSE
ncbi:uncharacterized protein [Prorops nasuta]|uniref:uncharacterized protein isoform X2 n=1 Tax=Prorops nasuta TaxID=863751 RepID=UPI0034CEF7D7